MTEEQDSIPADAAALIAALVQRNVDSLSVTTNLLLDGYQSDAAMAQATVTLIRRRIEWLLSRDYAPSERAIREALWPPLDLVTEEARRNG